MTAMFSTEQLETAYYRDVKMLQSRVFINENDKFTGVNLPSEIQYAPVYAISSADVNNDGHLDLIFGGNQYMVKPQFGKYDASKGWLVLGPIDKNSGQSLVKILNVSGQIRSFEWITQNNAKRLLVGRNNENIAIYEYKN